MSLLLLLAKNGSVAAPAEDALALVGYAPTALVGHNATPTHDPHVITGYAPTLSIGVGVSVSVGSVTAVGYAPTPDILSPVIISPATGAVSIDVGDRFFSNVTLLLPLDGTNGSTTFTDVTGKTVTGANQAQISTAQSKFGGASAIFDGSYDTLSSAPHAGFDFGTGDFTVECWFRQTNDTNTYPTLIANQAISFGSTACALMVKPGAAPGVTFANGNSVLVDGVTATSFNTWHHVALARSGTTIRLFLDGVLDAQATYTHSVNFGLNSLLIAHNGWDVGTSSHFNGYIDDVRLTKGVARYTTDFTPPTRANPTWDSAPALSVVQGPVILSTPTGSLNVNGGKTVSDPNWADTVLLCHFNRYDVASGNTFIDETKNHTITRLSGSQSPHAANVGAFNGYYSASFANGLSVADSALLDFGSGDFTIEFWYRMTSHNGTGVVNGLIGQRDSTTSNFAWHVEMSRSGDGGTSNQTFKWSTDGTTIAGSIAYASGYDQCNHYAIVRNGSTVTVYRNGTSVGSAAISGAIYNSSAALVINGGASDLSNPSSAFDDLRITKGVARYTSNFTAPTAQLPSPVDVVPTAPTANILVPVQISVPVRAVEFNAEYTVSLFHFEGTSGTALTANDYGPYSSPTQNGGGVLLSNAQAKFGSTSIDVNNASTGTTFTQDLVLTGNFTFEWWAYPTAYTSGGGRMWAADYYDFTSWFPEAQYVLGPGDHRFYMYRRVVTPFVQTAIAGPTVPLNQWTHFAIVQMGEVLTVYVNGVAGGSIANTYPFAMGGLIFGNSSYPFQGYIDEFRISRYAVYTGAFTPPSSAFDFVSLAPSVNVATPVAVSVPTGAVVVGTQPNAIVVAEPEPVVLTPTTGSLSVVGQVPTVSVQFVNPILATPSGAVSVLGQQPGASQSVPNPVISIKEGRLVAQQTDPFFNNVTLLLHMDGANGASIFTDELGHTVNTVGTITTSTAQTYFGNSSLYIASANAGRLTIEHGDEVWFGSGDFTVEVIFRPTSVGYTGAIVSLWDQTNNRSWALVQDGQNVTAWLSYGGGVADVQVTGTGNPISINNWYHMAMTRSGTSFMTFLNGSRRTVTDIGTNSLFNSTSLLQIGENIGATAYPFIGYIDEVRVTKGVARYTGATYDVPKTSFPNVYGELASPPTALVYTPYFADPASTSMGFVGREVSIFEDGLGFRRTGADALVIQGEPPSIINGTTAAVTNALRPRPAELTQQAAYVYSPPQASSSQLTLTPQTLLLNQSYLYSPPQVATSTFTPRPADLRVAIKVVNSTNILIESVGDDLQLTAYSPTTLLEVRGPQTIAPDSSAVQLIGHTPSVKLDLVVTPSAAATGVLEGHAPTVLALPPSVVLAPSIFVATGGTTPTTNALTPPASLSFQAGYLSDDTNPLPSLDLAPNTFTELEWAIKLVHAGYTYEFRVTNNGAQIGEALLATAEATAPQTGFEPDSASLTFNGDVPTLFQEHRPSPAQQPVGVIGHAPVALISVSVIPTPTAGVSQLTGYVPNASLGLAALPAAGSTAFTSSVPTTLVNSIVLPATRELSLGSSAFTIAIGGSSVIAIQTSEGSTAVTGQVGRVGVGFGTQTGLHTVTGYAPTLATTISVTHRDVAFAGQLPAPSVALFQTTGAGVLAISGQGASVGRGEAVSSSAAAFAGYAPALSLGVVTQPSSQTINLTGYAPSLTGSRVIIVNSSGVAVIGYTPTVVSEAASTVPTRGLALTGQAPSLGFASTPSTGAFAFTGYVPLSLPASSSTIPTGGVTVTGGVPYAALGLAVQPAVGQLVTTGYAPALTVTAGVGAGALAITGAAPTVVVGRQVFPSTGAVSITTYAPYPNRTYTLSPSTQALGLVGATPLAVRNHIVAPAQTALAFSGYVPNRLSNNIVLPDSGFLGVYQQTPELARLFNISTSVGALVASGAAPTFGIADKFSFQTGVTVFLAPDFTYTQSKSSSTTVRYTPTYLYVTTSQKTSVSHTSTSKTTVLTNTDRSDVL